MFNVCFCLLTSKKIFHVLVSKIRRYQLGPFVSVLYNKLWTQWLFVHTPTCRWPLCVTQRSNHEAVQTHYSPNCHETTAVHRHMREERTRGQDEVMRGWGEGTVQDTRGRTDCSHMTRTGFPEPTAKGAQLCFTSWLSHFTLELIEIHLNIWLNLYHIKHGWKLMVSWKCSRDSKNISAVETHLKFLSFFKMSWIKTCPSVGTLPSESERVDRKPVRAAEIRSQRLKIKC